MSKMLNWGILGTGSIAGIFARGPYRSPKLASIFV